MDFFERFKSAEYEFTYGALDGSEDRNALQVGVVAYFYIDKGYLPEKREMISEAFEYYHKKYGRNLKWAFFKDPNKPDVYSEKIMRRYQKKILDAAGDHVDFWCASEEGFEYASDYCVKMISAADWFEHVHSTVSIFAFYLPISEIHHTEDINETLLALCNILKPMHGLMGLGLQQCQEHDTFQHLEYEICQEFLGLDVSNVNTDACFRNGIRSINWYTFFNNQWLDKLGGIAQLTLQLNDPRINITSYSDGVIIKAGEFPELGWKRDNPYPELYAKVNNALKPIRAPKIGSLGYGSVAGEIRFNEKSTAKWLSRFDIDLPSSCTVSDAQNSVRITCRTNESSPYSGRWAAIVNGATQYIETRAGQIMPEFEDKHGQKYPARWSLLEREDGGSVFTVTPDEGD